MERRVRCSFLYIWADSWSGPQSGRGEPIDSADDDPLTRAGKKVRWYVVVCVTDRPSRRILKWEPRRRENSCGVDDSYRRRFSIKVWVGPPSTPFPSQPGSSNIEGGWERGTCCWLGFTLCLARKPLNHPAAKRTTTGDHQIQP